MAQTFAVNPARPGDRALLVSGSQAHPDSAFPPLLQEHQRNRKGNAGRGLYRTVRLKLAQTMKLDNSRTKSQRGYTQNSSFSTHAVAALKPTTPEPSSLHSLQVLHTTKFCPDIRIHKIIQGALLDRKACLAGYVKLWLSREPLLRSIPAVKQLPPPRLQYFFASGRPLSTAMASSMASSKLALGFGFRFRV